MTLISPSLLAANFADLKSDLTKIEEHADWLHLDIMDGCFVPNISYGLPVVKAVKKTTKLPLDAHLMIQNPDIYLQEFANAGVDLITVHAEVCNHLHRTVSQIRKLGCKAGVALNPHTDPSCLNYLLDDLDMVLVMSVNPGFGGQTFIESSINKIKVIKKMIDINNASNKPIIAVDGGINQNNIAKVAKAGVDYFVAGSAVFKAKNPAQAIIDLKDKCNNTRSTISI